MKRYIKVTFLIVFCTLLCCGCQGDITRAIRHEGFNVGDEFVCENFYPKDKEDTSYDKIKYLTGNQVIDENGKIYEISLSQKYANDSNCKAADTNIEVMAIFDNKIVKSSDGKLYNLNASNNVAAYSEVLNTDNYYELYKKNQTALDEESKTYKSKKEKLKYVYHSLFQFKNMLLNKEKELALREEQLRQYEMH